MGILPPSACLAATHSSPYPTSNYQASALLYLLTQAATKPLPQVCCFSPRTRLKQKKQCFKTKWAQLGPCPVIIHYLCTNCVVNINIRSEEHTSELQSRGHIVCRLLFE